MMPGTWKRVAIVVACVATYACVSYVDDLEERVKIMEAVIVLPEGED